MTSTIALIVDDNGIRQYMNAALSEAGYAVLEMQARMLGVDGNANAIDAVCLALSDISRFEWLQQIRAADNALPVIVITDDNNIAERAMSEGAYDVLVNPTLFSQVRHAVVRAVERRAAARTISDLSRRLAQYEGDEVVPIRELERQAIERALKVTRGSVTKAAKLLGIGRATLYRRLASPDLADIRARRNGEPVAPASMSSMGQAAMAKHF